MKSILFFLILVIGQNYSYAQLRPQVKIFDQIINPPTTNRSSDSLPYFFKDSVCIPDMNAIEKYLLGMPYVIDANNPKIDRLVSDMSFRSLVKSDFTKTVMGMDNSSKLDRYASLDISNKPSFDFTPLAWNSNVKNNVFRSIFSVNISGKLNNDGILEFKSLRDLTLKVNYIRMFNVTNYKPKDKIEKLRGPMRLDMGNSIKELCSKYDKQFKELCDSNFIPASKIGTKRTQTVEAFYEEFVDIEKKTAEQYWKSKNYYWVSINAGVKRDKVDYVLKTDIVQNKYSLNKETVFMPEVTIAFNGFHLYASGASILYTFWGAVKQRHSLSEVYTPDKFQPFNKLNDSLMQIKDEESVFVTDFTTIDKKIKADFGSRMVLMSPNLSNERKEQIGVSISYTRKALVHTDKAAALNRTELGLVFPFLKSDGTSKFNLELFHRVDNYSKFPNENEKTWGFRFNIPISN